MYIVHVYVQYVICIHKNAASNLNLPCIVIHMIQYLSQKARLKLLIINQLDERLKIKFENVTKIKVTKN